MANKLSKIIADFSTSLAVKAAVGATSGTLQSATDDDGVALPAGQYGLTLDGNSSNKEYWLCDLNGTALTNIQNISRQGVLTSGSVREHRIGASVKITNFADLLYINNLLDGTDTNENTPKFSNTTHSGDISFTGTSTVGLKVKSLTTAQRVALTPTTTAIVYDTTIGEYYVWQGGAWLAVASGSVQPNASTTVAGKIELATAAERAAGTATGGTGATLVPTNDALVKTSSGAADENKIGVLGADGKYAVGFLPATATPTASKIPIADADGKLLDWVYLSQFGDGSDGTYTLNAGQAAVGGLFGKSGSTFTLLKDAQFVNLTIDATFILETAGFAFWCTGTLTNNGTIQNNGVVGTAGSNNSGATGGNGGAGGAGGTGNTLVAGTSGGAGGRGANGGGGSITDGTAGTSKNPSLGSSGAAGGTGYAGNVGGAAGTATSENGAVAQPTVYNRLTAGSEIISLARFTPRGETSGLVSLSASAGSGGGGGGGGNDVGDTGGGGGGGGGGTGGCVVIGAKTLTNGGSILANGGNGGAGGNGSGTGAGDSRAGGGGGGGSGGVIFLMYRTITLGTVTAAAGTGGALGSGRANGSPTGTAGAAGTAGKIYRLKIG